MYALQYPGASLTQAPVRESFAFSRLHEGIPRGCLVEISGPHARAHAARFLAEHRHLPAVWIEESLKPFPEGIREEGPNLKKILFIEGAKDSSWSAGTVLRSGLFPVVVYRAPYGDIRELRRFRFHAQKANATMILLRDEPCFSWPIALQLRTTTEGGLEVLRRRREA